MQVLHSCQQGVRIAAAILLLALLSIFDVLTNIANHFKSRGADRAINSIAAGSHPGALQHIGVILCDPAAEPSTLLAALHSLIPVIQAAGVRHLTVHDVFVAISAADLERARAAHPLLTLTASSPASTVSQWARLWAAPPGATPPERLDGGTTAEHDAYLQARLASTLGPAASAATDLLLVLGPVLTLAGFPAWKARFCEIVHLGPVAADVAPAVRAALARYRQVLQRFGT